MTRKLRLVIMYGSVPLGTTADPSAVAAAAQAAVEESSRLASALDRADPHLGAIERAETQRLQATFRGLGLGALPAPVM